MKQPFAASFAQNFQQAVRLFQQGRLDQAKAVCKSISQKEPHQFELLCLLGVICYQKNENTEALEYLNAAVAIQPANLTPLSFLGQTYVRLGRFTEALAIFDRILAIKPDQAEALINRGNVLMELDRLDAALASHERALAAKPNCPEALYNRGNALKDLQRNDEALTSYDQAIALDPGNAEAYNNKGLLLVELGQLEAGCGAIETAIKLAPKNPHYYYSLMNCRRLTPGDLHLQGMEALARDTSSFNAEDQIQLYFGLAKVYADLSNPEQAMRHWLDGNALKRIQITYDAAADIALMTRTQAAFTAGLIASKAGQGAPSSTPIFILGMPRSGTTLIEQILASHPRVFGAGESDDLMNAVTRLSGTPMAKYSPDYLSRLSPRQLRRFGERYVEALRANAPSADKITDKAPENFRFIGLIHMALPNARIIHLRRDPVDTCLSCFSHLIVGNNLPFTYDLGELGRFYRAYEDLMAHWRRVLPEGAMLDVQYEEVVADLEGQTRRILDYCGLEWDPRCLDFHKTERRVRTASMVQVRQPLFKTSVGRWRAYEPYLGPLFDSLELAPQSFSSAAAD